MHILLPQSIQNPYNNSYDKVTTQAEHLYLRASTNCTYVHNKLASICVYAVVLLCMCNLTSQLSCLGSSVGRASA